MSAIPAQIPTLTGPADGSPQAPEACLERLDRAREARNAGGDRRLSGALIARQVVMAKRHERLAGGSSSGGLGVQRVARKLGNTSLARVSARVDCSSAYLPPYLGDPSSAFQPSTTPVPISLSQLDARAPSAYSTYQPPYLQGVGEKELMCSQMHNVVDLILMPLSLDKKQLPALVACMCGYREWQRKMLNWLPVLHCKSALYQLLQDGCEFLEMDARSEAARCLARLCSTHNACRVSLIEYGIVSLVCDILKNRQLACGFRVAVAGVLETITSYSVRDVLGWVQASRPFAHRVEVFVMRLLDILCSAREESMVQNIHTNESLSKGPDIVVYEVLKVVLHVVAFLKIQGWRAMIDRGGTEIITKLLQGPPMLPACAFELVCLTLSSLCMHAQARQRFRNAGGLQRLVENMRRSEMAVATTAAHAVRLYLLATDQLAVDNLTLLLLDCDRIVVSLLSRLMPERGGPRVLNQGVEGLRQSGGGGQGGEGGGEGNWEALAARVVPLLSMLLRTGKSREDVLKRNTGGFNCTISGTTISANSNSDMILLTLNMLRRASSASMQHESRALTSACLRLVSSIMSW